MTSEPPTLYVGWLRSIRKGRAGKWVEIAEAPSYWACWEVILVSERREQQCELVVLRKGIEPTDRSK